MRGQKESGRRNTRTVAERLGSPALSDSHMALTSPSLVSSTRLGIAPWLVGHDFRRPDDRLPGRFGLEWWISEETPLLATARERHLWGGASIRSTRADGRTR